MTDSTSDIVDYDLHTSSFLDASGPENLDVTFAIENDSGLRREEIIGLVCPFPDGPSGVYPSNISDYCFAFDYVEQQISVGDSSTPTSGSYAHSGVMTWAPLAAIVPGSIRLSTKVWVGSTATEISVNDDPNQGAFSTFLDPSGYFSVTSIDYSGGGISLAFALTHRPTSGSKIVVTYELNHTSLPTQWQVLRVWPSGRVRTAKAWCGLPSGGGVVFPPNGPYRTVAYLKLINDPSAKDDLPTWAPHSQVAYALNPANSTYLKSYVVDTYNNYYETNLIDLPASPSYATRESYRYEEDVLENPADNGGKGWMKVIRRRGYHKDLYTSATSIDRDFMSLTSYLYVPHNDRKVDIELRLGNDYQGSDPHEHTTSFSLGTGNGSTVTFTGTCANVLSDYVGNLRKFHVYVSDTITTLNDKFGNGTLYDAAGVARGSINYASGAVSATFATAPHVGNAVTCTYNHYYYRVGTGNGSSTSFSSLVLPEYPSQFSMHIRAGSLEGRDSKSDLTNTRVGKIIPYLYTPIYEEVALDNTSGLAIVCDGVTTAYVIQLAHTNIVPTTIKWRVATEVAYTNSSSQFGRDLPDGSFYGKIGANSGALAGCSVDYATGEITLAFTGNAPPARAKIVVDYGYSSGSTQPISGTIDYSSKTLNLTFATAPANNVPIYVSYIKNDLHATFNQDPNMHPLGGVGFSHWSILSRNYTDPGAAVKGPWTDVSVEAIRNNKARVYPSNATPTYGTFNTVQFALGKNTVYVESEDLTLSSNNIVHTLAGNKPIKPGTVTVAFTAGSNYVVRDNGSGSFTGLPGSPTLNSIDYNTGVVSIDIATNITVAKASYAYDRQDTTLIPGGGADNYPHEHVQDGASIPRHLSLYCGVGASADENIAWAAKIVHRLQPVATISAYNTRAYNFYEGTLKFITPKQNVANNALTRMYVDRSVARSDAALTNTSSSYTPVPVWGGEAGNNEGSMAINATGAGTYSDGVRGACAWYENRVTDPGTSGSPRSGHEHGRVAFMSEARQAVRWFYYASLFQYCRPGHTLWNIASAHTWERRSLYAYVAAAGGNGAIPSTPNVGTGTPNYSQQWLNRSHRHGYGKSTVSVTRGSSVVYFADNQFTIYTQPSSTYLGTVQRSGNRRIVIKGSTKVYTLVADASGNYTYLDTPTGRLYANLSEAWDGNTASGVFFSAFNDCEPGVSRALIPNDPRWYPTARIGCGRTFQDHGIVGDNASHHGSDITFEAWELTGSWMLWDRVRHEAESYLACHKDIFYPSTYEPYHDQVRANAWILKTILSGYYATSYLVGKTNFGFLTSSTYGSAKDRYKEFIVKRYTWWLDIAATGVGDPLNHLATGTKTKIKDAHVFVAPELEWFPANVGSTSPQYGGDGSLTEAQVKFGAYAFDYWPVWQTSYILPYLWACWREFRNDDTTVSLTRRGETDTVANLFYRLSNGTTNAMLDYALVYGSKYILTRSQPGFVGQHIPGRYGLSCTTDVNSNRNTDVKYPVQFIQAHPEAVVPLSSPVSYPPWTVDDYAIIAYYNRGGSNHTSYPSYVGSNDDKPGHAIPGISITTFEDGMPFAGIPYGGINSSLDPTIPSCTGNGSTRAGYPSTVYPCFRAPQKAETGYVDGWPFNGTSNVIKLNSAFAPSLYFALRFHETPSRRAEAAKVLNGWLYQLIARSTMTGAYLFENAHTKGIRIETEAHLLGPVTGDFPHSPSVPGGQRSRWWDTAWTRRVKLLSDINHSAYTANTDVISFDLTAAGITGSAQVNFSDLRVVYQTDDGSSVVLSSTVRKDAETNHYILFFVPSVSIAANEVFQDSEVYSYYVYWRNFYAPIENTWSNTTSVDGPYAPDGDTTVLWNGNGTVYHDDGPLNLPLQSISGFEPSYVSGPYGGAFRFQASSFDVAYKPYVPGLIPSGSFTLEFKIFIRAIELAAHGSSIWGISSYVSSTQFPWVIYKDGATNNIVGRFSIGSGQAYIPKVVQLSAPLRFELGTGNGSQKTFSSSLGAPVDVSKLSVIVQDDTSTLGTTVERKGGGVVYDIDGTNISVGGVSAADGSIGVTFVTAPASGKKVWVYYVPTELTARTWGTDAWHTVRYVYTQNSGISVDLNGTQAAFSTASGSLEVPTNAANEAVAVGCFYNQASLFQNLSYLSLTAFRISSVARSVSSYVPNKLSITTGAVEGIQGSGFKSASCNVTIASPRSLQHSDKTSVAVATSKVAPSITSVIVTENREVDASCAVAVQTQSSSIELDSFNVTTVAVTKSKDVANKTSVQIVGSAASSNSTNVAVPGSPVSAASAAHVAKIATLAAACATHIRIDNLSALLKSNATFVKVDDKNLDAGSTTSVRVNSVTVSANCAAYVDTTTSSLSAASATFVRVSDREVTLDNCLVRVQGEESLDQACTTTLIVVGQLTQIAKTYIDVANKSVSLDNAAYVLAPSITKETDAECATQIRVLDNYAVANCVSLVILQPALNAQCVVSIATQKPGVVANNRAKVQVNDLSLSSAMITTLLTEGATTASSATHVEVSNKQVSHSDTVTLIGSGQVTINSIVFVTAFEFAVPAESAAHIMVQHKETLLPSVTTVATQSEVSAASKLTVLGVDSESAACISYILSASDNRLDANASTLVAIPKSTSADTSTSVALEVSKKFNCKVWIEVEGSTLAPSSRITITGSETQSP